MDGTSAPGWSPTSICRPTACPSCWGWCAGRYALALSPSPGLPVPIRYRFALTGAGARDTDIVVAGDTASIEPAGTAAATVTCSGDTETFVLIMTGRLRLPDAYTQRRLVAEGAAEWVDAFAQWFGGV